MKCPVCGASNSEDARFCSLCLTPFRGDSPEPPPITSPSSTPPDYLSDTEEPPIKHPGKFSDWAVRIGCVVICLIVVIPLALIFLPPVVSNFFPPERGADCLRVYDTTFQEEVLESQIPVLVIFCTDELWNRKRAGYSSELEMYVQPAPIIVAVKRIINEGEFEGKIKFCKYYSAPPNDPLKAEYDIRLWPTTMIFRDGSIFWRTEAAGCFVDETMENIEVILKESIGEM